MPGGSAPAVTAKLTGGVAPCARRVAMNAAPALAAGNASGAKMKTGGAMARVRMHGCRPAHPLASVARTVNALLAVDGVPDSTPLLARVIPDGSDPSTM